MAHYTLAVGTQDPYAVFAESDVDAVRQAVDIVVQRYSRELRANPQEVATLVGPRGLVTRPSERIDEFVARTAGPARSGAALTPGDTNAPDCNGD